jgi:hypothetical protein
MADTVTDTKQLVDAQNTAIKETAKNIDDAYSTDQRKAIYEHDMMRGNNKNIFLLFSFYYALCVIVAFILYRSSEYSNWVKVLIVLAFLAYPFIISMIELKIYNIYEFLKAFVMGTIYSSSSIPFPKPPPTPVPTLRVVTPVPTLPVV